MDVSTGKVIARLKIPGSSYARAIPAGDDVYSINGMTVDLRNLTTLSVHGSELILRRLGGAILWKRSLEELGVGMNPRPEQRRLVGNRVVLAQTGPGLIALERSSGKTVWKKKNLPDGVLRTDHGLVLCAGTVAKENALHALALNNGAFAFKVGLPSTSRRLAAAPHGIAVAGTDCLVVFGRHGPKMFQKRRGFEQVAASRRGWVTMHGDQVIAWDRLGRRLWVSKRHDSGFFINRYQVSITGNDDVVITSNCRKSDSGVHCQALSGRDGGQRWSRILPGLGVDHSKYWHIVYTRMRGDRIDIVSQAMGGHFLVVLDARSGKPLLRASMK